MAQYPANMNTTGMGATGAGYNDAGLGNTGYGAADTGYAGTTATGMGGTGHNATAGMSMGDKVKAAIPGTAQNKEKKIMEGDNGVGYDYDTSSSAQGYPAGAGTTTGPSANKSMGTKIKEALPGTQEHKMHKMEKEMNRTY